MSGYQAIAGVSRTLRSLLRDRMEKPVAITIAPPDVTVSEVTGERLNLYLYQVSENAYLKNQDIPGRSHPAEYGRPPLSLDLFYLLTAHGSSATELDADLQAQQILADAMRVFHDYGIVTEGLTITRSAVGTVGEPIMDASLAGDGMQIKVSMMPTGLDELSKIWTALPQANFRRSVVYTASVVQIESRLARGAALPVKERHVHLHLLRRPEIRAVYRMPSGDEPHGDTRIRVGDEVTIEGAGFRAAKTWVRIGDLEPIGVEPESDSHIQLTLPDGEYPPDADHTAPRSVSEEDRLQPGPQVVEVLIERETDVIRGGLDRGVTETHEVAVASNRAVFMLVPSVSHVVPTSGTASDVITVTGTRLFTESVTSYVLIGDVAIRVREPGAGDNWQAPTATTVQVSLADAAGQLPAVPQGGLVLTIRVQVNGAQSIEEDKTFTLMP